LRVAEEVRLADRQLDNEIVQRPRVALDQRPVRLRVGDAGAGHGAADALLGAVVALRRKAQPGALAEQAHHRFVGGLRPAHGGPPSPPGSASSSADASPRASRPARSSITTRSPGSLATRVGPTPSTSSTSAAATRARSTTRS